MKVTGYFGSLNSVGGKEDIKPVLPAFTTTTLDNVTVFETFSQTIPITYSKNGPLSNVYLSHGTSLPSWATLTWTGADTGGSVTITGTPSQLSMIGTTNFKITAVNKFGMTEQPYSLTVDIGQFPLWNTTSLPSVVVYDYYSATMNLTVPTLTHPGPLTSLVVKSGTSLPNWATLSWSGTTAQIVGTPPSLAALGTTNFTLTATNRYGNTDQTFSIFVNDGLVPVWATNSLPTITLSSSASIQTMNITVPTGVDAGPLTNVTISSGSLPSWATLSHTTNTAVISGIPNNTSYVASTPVTLTATNRYGSTPQSFTLGVVNSTTPVWLTSSLPTAGTYVAYNQTIQVSCSVALTSVTTKSGSLPTGISYAQSGNSVVFSGTATAAGSSSITLTANTGTYHVDQAVSLTVSAPSGNQFYNSAGTYTFTVPANVGQLRTLAVGGGSGGGSSGYYCWVSTWTGGGAGSSGCETQAVCSVTPGQQISVIVGSPGNASVVSGYLSASSGGGSGDGAWTRSRGGGSSGTGGTGGTGGSGGGGNSGGDHETPGSGGGIQSININGSVLSGSYAAACVFKQLSGVSWGAGGAGSNTMAGGGGGGVYIFGQGGPTLSNGGNSYSGGGQAGQGGNSSTDYVWGWGGQGGRGFGGGGGGGGSSVRVCDNSNQGGAGNSGCVYIEWG